jgi:hypothetical protein
MERVLLGVWDLSFLTSKSSGFELSGAGDDGTDDSAEAGVSSNIRRGIGRRICSDMLDVEATGVDCRGLIGCTKRRNGYQAALSKNGLRLVPQFEKEYICTGVRC